jgi:SAM-dependent methyltransferase
MTSFDDRLRQGQEDFFKEKLNTYGPNYRGVGYNAPDRQDISFRQLIKICEEPIQPFSMIDYGCGYGALIQHLTDRGLAFTYTGFDITDEMIKNATALFGHLNTCRFISDKRALLPADYTVASGIFNMKLDTEYSEWTQYVIRTLDEMWALSRKGMAFNILTKYSEPEKMRPELYYADPCFLFDYCKTHYSRDVALLHDYHIFEFTILVRKSITS